MSDTFAQRRANNESANRDIASDSVRPNNEPGTSTPADVAAGDVNSLTQEEIDLINNTGPNGEYF